MLAYAANRPVAGRRPSSPHRHAAHHQRPRRADRFGHEREDGVPTPQTLDPIKVVNVPIDPTPPPNPRRSPAAAFTRAATAWRRPKRDRPPCHALTLVPLDAGEEADPGVAIGASGANGVPQFPTQADPLLFATKHR